MIASLPLSYDSDCGVFLRAYSRELIGRYVHLSQFVHQIELETRGETPRLLEQHLQQIASRTKKLVDQYRAQSSFREASLSTFPYSISLFQNLKNQARQFQEWHKHLRWMPSPWPETELFQFLKQVCHKPILAPDFKSANPTTVFSDEYNFLTSDLYRYGKSPIPNSSLVVWALPKCEIANPLLWPVLLHEVAHGVFNEKDLFKAVTDAHGREIEFPRSWVIELNADLFAFRLLGPAYLFCLIYFSVFFFDGNLRQPVVDSQGAGYAGPHPPPALRIRLLYEEMSSLQLGNSEYLRAVQELCQCMMRLLFARQKFDLEADGPSEGTSTEPEELEDLWNAIKVTQEAIYPGIDLPPSELEVSVDLLKRLQDDQIASSVKKSQPNHGEISEYLHSRFHDRGIASKLLPSRNGPSSPATSITRKMALKELNERAATVSEVLNAGWLQKVHSFGFESAYPHTVKNLLKPYAPPQWDSNQHIHEAAILEPTGQLRKSIQIALVFSSIRYFSQPEVK